VAEVAQAALAHAVVAGGDRTEELRSVYPNAV